MKSRHAHILEVRRPYTDVKYPSLFQRLSWAASLVAHIHDLLQVSPN